MAPLRRRSPLLPRFAALTAAAASASTWSSAAASASALGEAVEREDEDTQSTTSTSSSTNASAPEPLPWTVGTWTTGYWDCCKPSCAWPNKGKVDKPARSCDAETGVTITDPNARSVCQGGVSAMCPDHTPFKFRGNVSMGFAAAAVGGSHGLSGDSNCGQCFELRFTGQIHPNGNWGGADPELVGRRMIVQVNNIGYDVTGEHSFDIQIPGAGQGVFANGCQSQFRGFSTADFDCDNRYGGCCDRLGCARLPKELRQGCQWRFDWYYWLVNSGKTNNPYVDFRRVRCPAELVNISGSTPLDDEEFAYPDLPDEDNDEDSDSADEGEEDDEAGTTTTASA